MIIKNRYFISLIIEIMNWIKNAKHFIKLDIYNIFNHLHIAKENEYKIIFHTRYNHFEYLIISFDFYNTSTTFQFYINDILCEFLDEFYIIYLDNILIYMNDSFEDYINHIYQVFQCLLDNDFYIKLEKCKFHIQEIKFLDFIISFNNLTINSNHIIIIINWFISKS